MFMITSVTFAPCNIISFYQYYMITEYVFTVLTSRKNYSCYGVRAAGLRITEKEKPSLGSSCGSNVTHSTK